MGTRGYIIIKYLNRIYYIYNHHDSYPSKLGELVREWIITQLEIGHGSIDHIRKMLDRYQFFSCDNLDVDIAKRKLANTRANYKKELSSKYQMQKWSSDDLYRRIECDRKGSRDPSRMYSYRELNLPKPTQTALMITAKLDLDDQLDGLTHYIEVCNIVNKDTSKDRPHADVIEQFIANKELFTDRFNKENGKIDCDDIDYRPGEGGDIINGLSLFIEYSYLVDLDNNMFKMFGLGLDKTISFDTLMT